MFIKGKRYHIVERNHTLEYYKQKVREDLLTEIAEIRQKTNGRCGNGIPPYQIQPKFKRFAHRGLDKVDLEFGLHALAHIRKKSA